ASPAVLYRRAFLACGAGSLRLLRATDGQPAARAFRRSGSAPPRAGSLPAASRAAADVGPAPQQRLSARTTVFPQLTFISRLWRFHQMQKWKFLCPALLVA